MPFSVTPLSNTDVQWISFSTLNSIEALINKNFPNSDDINIVLSQEVSERSEEKEPVYRISSNYRHPLFGSQSEKHRYVELINIESIATKIAEKIYNQLNCSHPSDSIKRKTYNNRPYPDGTAICENCGVVIKERLPVLNNNTKIVNPLFDDSYVTIHDWFNIPVQVGSSGVVISKTQDNYMTAFFEAFPNINGMSTFIRGEGPTIDEAEEICYKKYMRQKQCEKHEFSRYVNGQYRKDGYGVCIHCGFKSSQALSPETLCCVCNEPTKTKLNENFYCFVHYFEEPFEEHLKDAIFNKSLFETDPNRSEIEMETYIEFYIKKSFFEKYGNTAFKKQSDILDSICHYFKNVYCHEVLGLKPFDDKRDDFTFPDQKNELLNKILDYLLENLDYIIDTIEKKDSVPKEFFVSLDKIKNIDNRQ